MNDLALRINRLPDVAQLQLLRLLAQLEDQYATRATPEMERVDAGGLFNEYAAQGGFATIKDPVAWQREQRADKPLPGRN